MREDLYVTHSYVAPRIVRGVATGEFKIVSLKGPNRNLRRPKDQVRALGIAMAISGAMWIGMAIVALAH